MCWSLSWRDGEAVFNDYKQIGRIKQCLGIFAWFAPTVLHYHDSRRCSDARQSRQNLACPWTTTMLTWRRIRHYLNGITYRVAGIEFNYVWQGQEGRKPLGFIVINGFVLRMITFYSVIFMMASWYGNFVSALQAWSFVRGNHGYPSQKTSDADSCSYVRWTSCWKKYRSGDLKRPGVRVTSL